MAKLTEITYGVVGTVQVGSYQYVKPELRVSVSVDEKDDYYDVMDKVKAIVHTQINEACKEIKENNVGSA